MADVYAYALRRCATSHSLPSFRRARGMSAARTRFQLTPDSVRGERMRRYAPQGGAAVDAVPECFSGGASATHLRRLLSPRRCRGLTESVTARAAGCLVAGAVAHLRSAYGKGGVCTPCALRCRVVRMGLRRVSHRRCEKARCLLRGDAV